MAKLRVKQIDGEIVFTPGGQRDPMTLKVTKGIVDVPDEMAEELSRHLDVPNLSPEELVKQAEQRAYDEERARHAEAENAKAVAEATAAGIARAAKESAKAG